MRPDEFRAICAELDMSYADVARTIGARARSVHRWAARTRNVPDPVAATMRLLRVATRQDVVDYARVAKFLRCEANRFEALIASGQTSGGVDRADDLTS